MRHLNQIELSRRWGVSPKTLENLRWKKKGPPYLKLGGRVAYRLADIEEYERANAHLTKGVAVPIGRPDGRNARPERSETGQDLMRMDRSSTSGVV
jgi:hypothetical protein